MSLTPAKISIPEALAADMEAFPADPFPGEASPVASGASGRRFFRIRRGEATRVLMAYPPEPRENQLFSAIGRALQAEKIPVPKIRAEDPERGLIWLEDLGERDLFSLSDDEVNRSSYYKQAIDSLIQLQNLPDCLFAEQGIETLPPFDEELYQFEQRYFQNELVSRLTPRAELSAAFHGEMEHLEKQLLISIPTWVHRDFQSKNLMIDAENKIRIVDFQGIRLGHHYYDLASLLCDPYANLPAAERRHHFENFCKNSGRDPDYERSAFAAACCQRLMQALGAYGRFGLRGGVEFFREKIPPALALLEDSAHEADLPELARLAEQLKNLDLPVASQVAEVKPVPTK